MIAVKAKLQCYMIEQIFHIKTFLIYFELTLFSKKKPYKTETKNYTQYNLNYSFAANCINKQKKII